MSMGNHIGGSALRPQGGYERERADDLDPHNLRDFDDETESKSESDSLDPRCDSTNTNPNADESDDYIPEPDDTDIFADDTLGNIIADTSNENTPDDGIAEVKTGDNTSESLNAPETLVELARDICEDKVEDFLTGNGNLKEDLVNGLLHSIKYQLKQADLTNVTSEEGDKLFREHMVEKF